jgi:hypothetical protein
MWFKRIKSVQLAVISLINYHFSRKRETEKVIGSMMICGLNGEFQPSALFLLSLCDLFVLFRRWRQRSTEPLRKPGRERHQQP